MLTELPMGGDMVGLPSSSPPASRWSSWSWQQ
jgi:hypothetical protein